ncbi:hypothetical protein J5N97_017564 [Dioscorea zingiberensis]|uniref:Cell division control protein 45 n=1 Tax=Dioscorea zingiberensis TaxID=325984 RepID=A0A9D5CM90_9LILI|nr:hypothetical protein J5N97_017564 [Dioscorea zingiberensis]
MVRECDVRKFYGRMRDAVSAAAASPLLIFPSASDADSLCALKIITHVLSSDSIRYAVYPVSSFHEINDRVIVLHTPEDEDQPTLDLSEDIDVLALANASDLNSDDELDENPDSDVDSENQFVHQRITDLRIAFEDEPRLMLLREWNLFDSMLCSSYIATKLKTWSDNGLKKLMLLLARMGFPLVECQKKFQYMSMEVKQRLKSELIRFLPEYGLTDLYYRSFLRMHGYSSKVSAADVVYGVTALLESFVEGEESSAAEQFWVAYSALSSNNLNQLKKGMQNAIELQRAILRQGSLAITKTGFIRSGRKFRWVKLEDPVDTKCLGHPQALTKFCFFLMDALKERAQR